MPTAERTLTAAALKTACTLAPASSPISLTEKCETRDEKRDAGPCDAGLEHDAGTEAIGRGADEQQ